MHAITAVSFAPNLTPSHASISRYCWLDTDTGVSLVATRQQMVDFLSKLGNHLWVGGEDGWAEVRLISPRGRDPYLQTEKDDTPTDNLLNLPQF